MCAKRDEEPELENPSQVRIPMIDRERSKILIFHDKAAVNPERMG